MFLFEVFIIVILIQIFYYFFLFGRFSFYTPKKSRSNTKQPVSVVICAKNEEQNLKKYLPFIANQNYSNFEIILVNDASNDNSLQAMHEFKNRFQSNPSISKIQIISLDISKGKKNALEKGIKASSNKIVLLTDADCKPVSKEWISSMSVKFSKTTRIVLGYGSYQKIKNSNLNKLIRFETLITAIQYFSYAKMGMPYMGVGRNIAYAKNEFIKANGFKNHNHIKSGDDDLFINQIATKNNTSICVEKNSFTISNPKTTFKNWFYQKRRHISTAIYYKKKHRVLLGLFYISQFLFLLLSVILFVKGDHLSDVLLLIFIRYIFWYLAISKSAIKLNEADLIVFAPFFEIGIISVQLCIFIVNKFSPIKKW